MLSSVQNNQLMTNATYIGIDFGTSTTVVSIATKENENKIKTLPIKLTQTLQDGTRYQSEKLPSVIAWFNKKLLVGEGASNLKYTLTKGKNIWYSFKMEIGEDLGAKYYNSEVGDLEGIKIRNPKDCVRVFFMYLRMLITRYCKDHGLSDNIKYSVSIPASFEANQRKELMEALETNGMTVSKQSLIDEPNAAFISYVHDSEDSEKPLLISPHYNSKVLVFDFGGGTCDISILEIGKAATGLYSKNVAISKFTKLGGDDVDRYITYKYLMPRFFEYNNVKAEDFRTKERQYIATQLYKVAERLKILMCRKISNLMYDLEIPAYIKTSTDKESISVPVIVDTMKGSLSQTDFYLTFKELTDTMTVFMKKSGLPTQLKGQDDYNNIFMPVNSAIRKANVKKAEIDYVLLIGGSAQNPFIQEALKKEFDESQILVPQDLQTHVSKGAAIHSLLMNGMNKCIIQPITSEPILVITKDSPKVILPAGTTIPSDTYIVDDLVTSRDQQDVIELPICVGNANKMLFNLKIELQNGCPINTVVKLALEVNADKLLLAQASCMGVQCAIEPQNPFANKELTTEERIVLIAERQANLEAEQNNGIPTKNALIKLRNAYEEAGNDFRAAETLELQLELYPSPSDYNYLGVLYHNSGNYQKAIPYLERALEYSPDNVYANFNLGNTLKCAGRYSEARPYLERAFQINPDHYPSIIEMARLQESQGKHEEAMANYERAYDKLMRMWKTGTLENVGYGWLASVAERLGHLDVATEIRRSKPSLSDQKYYNDDNLVRTKTNSLEKL